MRTLIAIAIAILLPIGAAITAEVHKPMGPQPSPDVMTEQEMRAIISELHQQIIAMQHQIDKLIEGYVPRWLDEGGFDFALFAESSCFGPVRDIVSEFECKAFVVYNEQVQEDWDFNPEDSVPMGGE